MPCKQIDSFRLRTFFRWKFQRRECFSRLKVFTFQLPLNCILFPVINFNKVRSFNYAYILQIRQESLKQSSRCHLISKCHLSSRLIFVWLTLSDRTNKYAPNIQSRFSLNIFYFHKSDEKRDWAQVITTLFVALSLAFVHTFYHKRRRYSTI